MQVVWDYKCFSKTWPFVDRLDDNNLRLFCGTGHGDASLRAGGAPARHHGRRPDEGGGGGVVGHLLVDGQVCCKVGGWGGDEGAGAVEDGGVEGDDVVEGDGVEVRARGGLAAGNLTKAGQEDTYLMMDRFAARSVDRVESEG